MSDRMRSTQDGSLTAAREMPQREMERLRDDDPIAWLRDKARRRVACDTRGRLNALAVLRICALAEAALAANVSVCQCAHGASGSHAEECPCYHEWPS